MPNLALKNLLHDKLRSAMTIAGVAFAVTLVFVQVGLFMGILDNASVTIDHLQADLWVTSRNTPNVDFARWREAVGERENVKLISYPQLNHLFMTGKGKSVPAEYFEPGNMAEAVIDDIAKWVLAQPGK